MVCIRETPIKMDDLEVPPFQETSKSILDLFCSIMGVSQDHLLQGISFNSAAPRCRDAFRRHLGVSWNGGSPSYHPLIDGIFPDKPSSYWATSICGNSHLNLRCLNKLMKLQDVFRAHNWLFGALHPTPFAGETGIPSGMMFEEFCPEYSGSLWVDEFHIVFLASGFYCLQSLSNILDNIG